MTRRPAAVPVAWASAAAFLAVFAGLAFQMRQGRDPVLRAGHDGASAVMAPRRVLIRRVVKRRVIVRVIPAEPAAGTASRCWTPAGSTAWAAPRRCCCLR